MNRLLTGDSVAVELVCGDRREPLCDSPGSSCPVTPPTTSLPFRFGPGDMTGPEIKSIVNLWSYESDQQHNNSQAPRSGWREWRVIARGSQRRLTKYYTPSALLKRQQSISRERASRRGRSRLSLLSRLFLTLASSAHPYEFLPSQPLEWFHQWFPFGALLILC